MKNIPGIVVAAVGSGSGKTLITCALLSALKTRGLNPHAYKCGPDYIDPMYHRTVLGVPSNNLDGFFSDIEQLKEIFAENMRGSSVAVVEGAMGLYDGISISSDEGSAYHIASILDLPVLLIIDAHGMGRSVLPLIKGFLEYDKDKRIAGVFLNRVSEGFYKKIAPFIEDELGIVAAGFLPNDSRYSFESRHLGLKMPGEMPKLKGQIEDVADALERGGFIDNIIGMMNSAARSDSDSFPHNQFDLCKPEDLHKSGLLVRKWSCVPRADADNKDGNDSNYCDKCNDSNGENVVKIGVARDEAFCFYYEENLRMLEKYGAEIVFFSPVHDNALPAGIGAVVFGGGYPELYAKELFENYSMRLSIKEAVTGGMPSVAECGGFMYLHEFLKDSDGNEFAMCGVIPGRCFYTGKLVRFGYVNIEERQVNFLGQGGIIKGHEFHYYDSESNGSGCIASKPFADKKWDCIFDDEDHFWGFPHLYYPSNPDFVVKFMEKARAYCNRKPVC